MMAAGTAVADLTERGRIHACFDGPPDNIKDGRRAAGKGPIAGKPRLGIPDRDGSGRQMVVTVWQARGCHGIGHECNVVRAHQFENHGG
jgi:hypothetical protein